MIMTGDMKKTAFCQLLSDLFGASLTIKFRLFCGIVLSLVALIGSLLLPWCLKYIIDYFYSDYDPSILIWILASYGFLWMSSQALMSLRQIIVYRAFERAIHKISLKVFEKLLTLPLAYHVTHATGCIMNAVERAQAAIPGVLFGLFFTIIPTVIEILLAVWLLGYYYGSHFSLVLLCIFVSYLIITWKSMGWVVTAQRAANQESQRVSSYITDVLINIEAIHYQLGYKAAMQQCEKRVVDREDAVTRELVRMDLIHLCQIGIAGIGFIFLTLLVGRGVMKGELVISDFVLFNGYLIQFLGPLNTIATTVLRNIREGLTRMEGVMNILYIPISEPHGSTINIIDNQDMKIDFRKISFCYPNSTTPILNDINFSLNSGETIALLGENGSGKSTISKLLYRLYDAKSGNIFLNGEDITNIKLSVLRGLIGIVPQDVFILNDSIYNNLTFGNEVSTDSPLFKRVMMTTKLDKWVAKLPDGYNSHVGERGVKLSGGEKQRIGLARVLLKEPKVLVLDEATTALDNFTEKQIFLHLRDHYPGLAKLLITHDSKNLRYADKVIYLRDGAILEDQSVPENMEVN